MSLLTKLEQEISQFLLVLTEGMAVVRLDRESKEGRLVRRCVTSVEPAAACSAALFPRPNETFNMAVAKAAKPPADYRKRAFRRRSGI